jgi:hypothetical protein
MGNHYHLLIGTPDGNLLKGMSQLGHKSPIVAAHFSHAQPSATKR